MCPRLCLLLLVYIVCLFCLFIYLFTSASGWLKDEDHEVVRRVSLRIEDVTGLTMDTAEELQVCSPRVG